MRQPLIRHPGLWMGFGIGLTVSLYWLWTTGDAIPLFTTVAVCGLIGLYFEWKVP